MKLNKPAPFYLFITAFSLMVGFHLITTVEARPLDEIFETNNISIAVYNNFPPYSFKDKDGNPKGIDVELAKLIAQDLQVKLELYWTDADESLEDDLRNVIWKGHLLTKKKVDLMLRVPYDSAFNNRKDEATGELKIELAVITSPYQSESWGLLLNKKIIPDYKTPAIFAYEKVAVEIDSLMQTYFLSSFNGQLLKNTITYRDLTANDIVADFKAQKFAAIAGEQSRLQFIIAKLSASTKENYQIIQSSRFLFNSKPSWDVGIAVDIYSRDLAYHVAGIWEDLINSKKMVALFKSYQVSFKKADAF